MELKEAIDKLFEMTDEQRVEVFDFSNAEEVLNSYVMSSIVGFIEEFYSEPKYGDVYLDKDGRKIIVLNGGLNLCEEYEAPQELTNEFLIQKCTKTGKNVAYELRGLFK
jgi:hypothetical protein